MCPWYKVHASFIWSIMHSLTSWLRRSWTSGLLATSVTFIWPSASDTLKWRHKQIKSEKTFDENIGEFSPSDYMRHLEIWITQVREQLTGKVWALPSVPGQRFHQQVHLSAWRFFLQEHHSGCSYSEESCSLRHPRSLWSLPDLLSLCHGCLWPTTCPERQSYNTERLHNPETSDFTQ